MSTKKQSLKTTDTLTLLPNYFAYQKKLAFFKKKYLQNSEFFSLFLIDLDNFKKINYSFGDKIGDEVLCEVAKRLQSIQNDRQFFVARFGGDQFAIILSKSDCSTAREYANKLLDAISYPYELHDTSFYLTACIGMACTTHSHDIAKMHSNAEMALATAKKMGTNYFQYFTPEIRNKYEREALVEQALYSAIKKQEFHLEYQPIYHLKTKKLYKIETLLRWKNKQLHSPSVKEFIPIAESSGLIVPIGEWVLKTANQQFAGWYLHGYKKCLYALNLSVNQLSSVNLVGTIIDSIKNTRLPYKNLVLELTETAVMSPNKTTQSTLRRLVRKNISLAIDDFGTGYSSLSRLEKLPIRFLKIDQSFVKNIAKNLRDLNIVKAIIHLAKTLDLIPIAEGIETKKQLQLLIKLGCSYGQGNLFSKPVSAEKMSLLLKEDSDK